jgi:murein DD-endopeptidase MepM/ murein hydrolase activator NlpD
LTAIGTKSEAYGSVTIQIIGGAEAEKDPEDEENDGEDDKEKSPEEKAEEEKKKEDEAKQKQEDEQQQKATLADWFNKEARKKILDGIKKKFSKEALAAFWKAISPYMPWIILGIVTLLIGIAIMSGITADAGTGKAGSTFKKPADPVTDSAAIEKTIIAAGDKETVAKVNDQTFTDIQKQLTQLEPSAVKNSSPISKATKDKITETSTKINQYLAKKDPVLGREIITSVKSILESTNEQAPAIAVKTRLPLETISGFNWELHYGTPLRKEMLTGETGHSTYMYYGEGKADAVDLYTNQSALVYPMFDGQIVNISDDGAGHKKVVIKNGDYELLYAHIDLEKNIGQGTKVTTDKSIGQVATISEQSQLHLELSCGGIPIITTLLDKLNYEQTVGKSWGEFLWTHIKKVLGQ